MIKWWKLINYMQCESQMSWRQRPADVYCWKPLRGPISRKIQATAHITEEAVTCCFTKKSREIRQCRSAYGGWRCSCWVDVSRRWRQETPTSLVANSWQRLDRRHRRLTSCHRDYDVPAATVTTSADRWRHEHLPYHPGIADSSSRPRRNDVTPVTWSHSQTPLRVGCTLLPERGYNRQQTI